MDKKTAMLLGAGAASMLVIQHLYVTGKDVFYNWWIQRELVVNKLEACEQKYGSSTCLSHLALIAEHRLQDVMKNCDYANRAVGEAVMDIKQKPSHFVAQCEAHSKLVEREPGR